MTDTTASSPTVPQWRCRDCEFSPIQDCTNFSSMWNSNCRSCERIREYRHMAAAPRVLPSTYRSRLHSLARSCRLRGRQFLPDEEQAAVVRCRKEIADADRRADAVKAEREQSHIPLFD